ncbi:MAG TPA: chromosomal replication initiator protein DnaA [Deltaproteobacteria bacterium]|nr:MAG: chromosomal replication initiation protein DnaA [Deltaproteobacteria bacterium GWA2_55_82]OGQ62124.1 MAG: chromosomal replication initiation protein DnaA [Deltaproteobacteria bacterium RIFCSPLOWO2_02_FULL_55_12]OIJ75100.1 MAG: chromosomal replication initiation protein DnaA [Deltaproteobacteria bacterium GWC2_55_46]HBG46688.1 chromosomal replication initiator protein DnaA [Deltaproteobacteria bacterium]HCY11304.1 chromosomal replication initiator protein DnaA [Deltaproteobacteria bacter
MDSEAIWKNCLNVISAHVSPQHIATWFRPIKPAGANATHIELEVPNRFFLEWIKEHYLPLVEEALRQVSKKEVAILWKVGDEPATKAAAPKKKEKEKDTVKAPKQAGLNLNPKYIFENFVVGKANEFAHAACSAVANHLGSKYNPLFIYGCVGLGKTHLLQAIGHKVLQANPGSKVCYYTSERFVNDFINYVSRQKMSEFRSRFRNVDVLLIDDIQFWAGKEGTQEEFFHTFNTLYENHKQIVVTSDKFPKDLDRLEERLRSRFEWGLVADIQPPDIETKMAILRKKSKVEGVRLPDDVAGFLAEVNGSNVRELEGFLNRIIAVSSLTNKEIDLSMAKEALKHLVKVKEEKVVTIDEIQKAVASFYDIKYSDLKSKRRHKNIALPRQIAMFIAREYGGFSFPEIGSSFGGKDHSTAIHACKKIANELKENQDIRQAVKSLKQNIGIR